MPAAYLYNFAVTASIALSGVLKVDEADDPGTRRLKMVAQMTLQRYPQLLNEPLDVAKFSFVRVSDTYLDSDACRAYAAENIFPEVLGMLAERYGRGVPGWTLDLDGECRKMPNSLPEGSPFAQLPEDKLALYSAEELMRDSIVRALADTAKNDPMHGLRN